MQVVQFCGSTVHCVTILSANGLDEKCCEEAEHIYKEWWLNVAVAIYRKMEVCDDHDN